MSTTTASSVIAVEHGQSRLTSTLPRATALVGVLAAAATTALAAILRAAGVPLSVHGQIPLAAFAQFTFIGAVMGGVLVALLIRRSTAPRQRFVQIAAGLTALSCVAPLAFADTVASKFALVGLHLVAAAIIVPVLARYADRPTPTRH
jgi:peptidoglycan/LPS O-acetylase OafA/YrhL